MSTKRPLDLSLSLSYLEPLGSDQYFIACGPGGTQLCGTPSGYSATFLPSDVCDDISSGKIKRIVWATFGGDPHSHFIIYELKDGKSAYNSGRGTPTSLQPFVDWATSASASSERAASLRVQLGDDRSWIAWTGGVWACRNIPAPLLSTLRELSYECVGTKLGWRGSLMSGRITNITWHRNGSYYVKANEEHWWKFESDAVKNGWGELWHDEQNLAELAHVSFDPHSATGDTFTFIKKQDPGKEADFVLQFEQQAMISRLAQLPEQVVESEQDEQHVHIAKASTGPEAYQWAFAKHSGRSHPTDDWELKMKKGEKLKVLRDMGKGWYVVRNMQGEKGWAHSSQLDFKEQRSHVDPREAYTRWAADTEELLKPGAVRSFPQISGYMNACGKDGCQQVKQEPLGICAHDLYELLRGSGEYSLEFLKSQRNKWHPDKFARFCHPEHRDGLKPQAEALFVLFGVLMDSTSSFQRKGGAK